MKYNSKGDRSNPKLNDDNGVGSARTCTQYLSKNQKERGRERERGEALLSKKPVIGDGVYILRH